MQKLWKKQTKSLIKKSLIKNFFFSYPSLLNDVSIVWRAFSLPVLEPLTSRQLEKITIVTLGCLYSSIVVAVSNTIVNLASAVPMKNAANKDEELEDCGMTIVQKTVSIYLCDECLRIPCTEHVTNEDIFMGNRNSKKTC